ncbi:MAG: hypothetical protein ACLFWL_04465 [Candidatus Brocadiia bacterium]
MSSKRAREQTAAWVPVIPRVTCISALLMVCCGLAAAAEVVEVQKVPRLEEVQLENLAFGISDGGWRLAGKQSRVRKGSGPDGRATLVLESGGSAVQTITVGRGRVVGAGRRYLLTVRARSVGEGARAHLRLRRKGTVSSASGTTHTPVGSTTGTGSVHTMATGSRTRWMKSTQPLPGSSIGARAMEPAATFGWWNSPTSPETGV